jgi:hypothetical protein
VRRVLLAFVLCVGLPRRAVSSHVILSVHLVVCVCVSVCIHNVSVSSCFVYVCRRCARCHRCTPLVMFHPPVFVFVSMDSLRHRNLLFSSWNVRGLGDEDKCSLVRDNVASSLPSVMCFQESKLAALDAAKARSFLPSALSDFAVVDANGSRGGGSSPPGTGVCSLCLPPSPKFLA